MNYRHIYHAGNICDVVKHAVLVLLMEHVRMKDNAFCVLDTHAGVGLYDLQDERAAKTNEAQNGISKLLAAPPIAELKTYYDILQKLNPQGDVRYYPGSPLLIYHLLRAQDKLIACELHEEDARELRRNFHEHKNAHIHRRDAYEALRAFLPPEEKRGCVLIDPPFEQPDEFEKLAAAVIEAHKRWPQGMFLIWYPIKERPTIWRFHEALIAAGTPKMLCAEFIYEEEIRADRLNGCGLILINPPWQMDERLRQLLPALHEALKTKYRKSDVKWLTPE
jgi:23S rRNA (adenine2030-N6)-methyltransferase